MSARYRLGNLRGGLFLLAAMAFSLVAVRAHDDQAPAPFNRQPVNRVRFFPAPGHEQDMVGGRFEGSNVSERTGYEVLGEIKSAPPANQWTELALPTKKYYRWVRYLAPPGSYGHVAEVEFYAGDARAGFGDFGSLGHHDAMAYMSAMDGKTDTYFESTVADGQYVGTDVGYWVDPAPHLDVQPAPGTDPASVHTILPAKEGRSPDLFIDSKGPVQVAAAWDNTPDTIVRYAFDGSPTATTGQVYSAPIPIDHTTTVFAIAYRKGFAPSPLATATCVIGDMKPGLSTLHIGNSLTGSSLIFGKRLLTAGIQHDYHTFELGGSATYGIWKTYVEHPDTPNNDKITWNQQLAELTKLDHLTLQVQDVNMDEEVTYDQKFCDVFRARFPAMQPWLYCVWNEMFKPPRAVQLGQEPSAEMKTIYPALTWEEQSGAWLLYVEDVKTKLDAVYAGDKKVRILPNAIAAGWLKNDIDHGKLPGIQPDDFPFIMFKDNYHPGPAGRYLLDLVWYSAFYGESPEGKVLPVQTDLTGEQAAVLQRLAWDVVRNYPGCGLYQEGTTPVAPPQFTMGQAADGVTPVTLSSSTPGAWFRYTLDGTTPTRTCGYVYCGLISLKPGMTLKAIAYESGLADSTVSQAPALPAAP